MRRQKQTEKLQLIALVFLFMGFLSSCGFHLRGAYQLPGQMATSYIQADNPNSELVRSLARSLTASGITLVDRRELAQSTLKISNEKQDKRILSVDSRGRAREYTLMYSVSFSVSGNDSDFNIAEQTLELERDFLFDTEDVLGKGREEAVLKKDMQQDIVRLIMLRLEAAGRK